MRPLYHRLFFATCFAVCTTGVYILYRFNPLRYPFYPVCLFKKLTGLDCPGCGSTRALYSLLHGRLVEAADYNLLAVLFIPVIVCGMIRVLTGKGEKLWSKLNKPFYYFIIICVFFFLRNINIYPFTWLSAGK